MWNGKLKALTFSFDDGVMQDKRLIELLDKYNLKATFNLNSEGLIKPGMPQEIRMRLGTCRTTNRVEEVKDIYKNHEVACHTLHHPNLTELSKEEVIQEVEQDRLNLINFSGQNVVGLAYPCGGTNNNEEVAEIIKNNTGIKYCRTITSTYSFDLQDNLLRFNPTIYYRQVDKMFELADEFINLKPEKPQLFYIWGHAYELDGSEIDWVKFEELCQKLANRDDIYYCTNKQAFNLE